MAPRTTLLGSNLGASKGWSRQSVQCQLPVNRITPTLNRNSAITVHSVRDTYDPSRPFGPWLVSIANRRIVDVLRRRGRVGSHETSGQMELETFAAGESNLQEEAVNARQVRDAIEQLPVGQRDAMRMLKREQMSLQEAATASGTSVAALKVATHRAMKRLREMLQQRGKKS